MMKIEKTINSSMACNPMPKAPLKEEEGVKKRQADMTKKLMIVKTALKE
jgi:hypothetical protein